MTLILDLPADVLAQVQTDARRQNRDAAQVAAERLAEWYAAYQQRVTGLAEGQMLLTEPAHRFDLEDTRARHGLPPGRTRDQVEAAAEEAIDAMTPAQRAEAERLGLLG